MKSARIFVSLVLVLAGWVQVSGTRGADHPLPLAQPEAQGISGAVLAHIDDAVNQAIRQGKLPGAVVVVIHQGRVVFRKAYGQRSVQPKQMAMAPEVIFDLASLTKPIATALSILWLVENGKLGLADLVGDHVPGMPVCSAAPKIWPWSPR